MKIVVTKADQFTNRIYTSGHIKDIDYFTKRMDQELINFNNKNKILFLQTVINKSKLLKSNHEKLCNKAPEHCPQSKVYNIGLFVFEQKYEELVVDHSNEQIPKDSFTGSEMAKIISRLDELKTKLDEQGMGQEIIFNEIDELKEHFNLGKKNFVELFIGKLFKVGGEKLISAVLDSGIAELQKLLS